MEGDSSIFNANSPYSNVSACPLCQSEIKLFFINLNEKLLMCENVECEYPFGYEDLQFFKEDNNAKSMEEVCSISSKRTLGNNSATCSIVSAAAWSEIDRMNRVFESDDSQLECAPKRSTRLVGKSREKDNTMKKVECIKGLNHELKEMNRGCVRKISNKKYIKSLMNIQSMSGVEMLQPEELDLLKKEKAATDSNVKIDVNTDNESCISSIKIEFIDITNQEKATNEKSTEDNC